MHTEAQGWDQAWLTLSLSFPRNTPGLRASVIEGLGSINLNKREQIATAFEEDHELRISTAPDG